MSIDVSNECENLESSPTPLLLYLTGVTIMTSKPYPHTGLVAACYLVIRSSNSRDAIPAGA